MSDERDRDLKDVPRQERSRGRKERLDIEAERQRREEEQAVLDVLRSGDEKQFRELMGLLGFSTEETEVKIKAFRAVRAELLRRGP